MKKYAKHIHTKLVKPTQISEEKKREIIRRVIPQQFTFFGRFKGRYIGGDRDFMGQLEVESFQKDGYVLVELYSIKEKIFCLVGIDNYATGIYHNINYLMENWELNCRFVLTEKYKPEQPLQIPSRRYA